MSAKILLASVVALVVGVGVWYWFTQAAPTITATEIRYVSPESGEEITARYTNRDVTLTAPGYSAVTLEKIQTTTGSRYEDLVSGLTLWNTEAEVTLYQGEAIIFTGVDAAALPSAPLPQANPVADLLRSVSWAWKETIMSNGTRILPSTPGAFSVTFSEAEVVGTTDCNNFGGSYSLTNAALSMGPLRMTKMYCADSTEQAFAGALSGQTTVLFTTEGNLVLLLKDDAGSVFFTRATSTPAVQ